MKNFKKVISAVIALAISASTLVSASSFTDVADTASYAEAIDVLSSLGIVNGYEDGTFKPEGEITRAEAATMIVGALNMTADAVNAAGTTQFADVNEKAAWASGYINVGVAQKFISGMGDGTFAPQANVTYAQMCVMLTIISGYGDYAANGGYPTGYTTMAATTGINKGVSVGDNTALTRGQVAQMIYNTLLTPMLGVSKYNFTGNEYAQLDGTDGKFKTLLSDKFDGYAATVKIVETPVADGLDNDKVKFQIQKADWWVDGTEATPFPAATQTGYFAEGVNVNSNKFQVGKAVFVFNEDDEPVMVYFAATGKTETVEIDAEEYVKQAKLKDANQYSTTNAKIRFGSKYYTLESKLAADGITVVAPAIYVNGIQKYVVTNEADVLSGLTTAQTELDKYLANAVGTIKLVDDGEAQGYEAIFVEIWNVAEVLGVEYDNSKTTVTITTKNALTGETAYDSIVIDDEYVEEGKTVVAVEKNGEAVELTSLAKGDIIAYKSDINDGTGTALDNPKEIEIIATNDKATGKVTAIDNTDETITIDGTVYSATKWGTGGNGMGVTPALANSYELTLDPFGRIYEAKVDGSSAKLAIALNVTSDEESIKLLLADGTTKTYTLKSGVTINGFAAGLSTNAASNGITDVKTYLNSASLEADKRVVEYKVKNSTGEITDITRLTTYKDNAWAEGSEGEYKDRSSLLGSSKIAADTAIIDASKVTTDWKTASGYSKFNAENLKNKTKYNYVSFLAPNTTNYIGLVVIKEVGTKINVDSRFAVVRGTASLTETEEGDTVYALTVLLDGEGEKVLNFNSNPASAPFSLARGDAFFYEVDGDGIVTDAFKIVTASTKTFTDLATALTAKGKASYISTTASDDDAWTFNLINETKHDVQLVEGYVIPSEDGVMAFAYKHSPLTNINTATDLAWTVDTNSDGVNDSTANDGIAIFTVTDDTEAYVYDMSNGDIVDSYDKFSVKADTAQLASTGLETYETDGVYNNGGADMSAKANYAVAMIVDDVVETVYVIK